MSHLQRDTGLMTDNIRVCSRCIVDSTVPGAVFDEKGECSYCKLHDKLSAEFPNGAAGKKIIERHLQKIKASGKGKKYDCVLGLSGGRDSTFTLYLAVKEWGLRPLAVHFNDGFGNPVAGENMIKACKKLGVELRTITSDWRESKDLKIAFLKASTPDMEEGTDIGIATALYGAATKENIKYIVIGQSFRTEGIMPLPWNYLDGKYLREVHKMFGKEKLRPWKPDDPGFHLDVFHLFYYTVIRGIRTLPLLYYYDYVRAEAEKILKSELDWVYPGAHYYDDLYQALMQRVYREKFGIDRRKINYSALIRSGQMKREEALERIKEIYVIEDPKVIDLCIKRLGLTKEEFDDIMKLPHKTFRDYPNHYNFIKYFKLPVKILSKLQLLPGTAYHKYFSCG
jgi:N-acetyl sugar amidotransferase